ncbi:hypothetical protein CABS01_04691 [Colletotrichum abscissum]|uniref:uncharacterized protein n=1 Tax=Colletotrichum abscissum TaxID=1671311 RepID=UPI0027D70E1E|nr:uncharacterized protein CABS01_04691 [Colletotrichum abscissum]KAK1472048.1 hypothetical protein CABS01_04691 [Colletotrichum abscissum]
MDIGGKSEHLQHAHLYTRHMWDGQSLLPPPQRADAVERVPRNTPNSDEDHGTERRKIVRRWKGTHSVINPNLEIAPENRGTQRPFMALRVTVCKITMVVVVVVVVRCHFLCSVRQARKLFHNTLYALLSSTFLSSTFRCQGGKGRERVLCSGGGVIFRPAGTQRSGVNGTGKVWHFVTGGTDRGNVMGHARAELVSPGRCRLWGGGGGAGLGVVPKSHDGEWSRVV